jgi:hypothetical protein
VAENGGGENAVNADQTDTPEGADDPKLIDAEWLAKQYKLVKLNINGLFKGASSRTCFSSLETS